MQGQLFSLLDQSFPSYFVLLLTGFIFATAVGVLWAKRVGLDPDVVVNLGLAMLIAGVAGGRVLHVFADGYFWDYVHLCTDPSLVDQQISRVECESARFDGLWDTAKGVCHPRPATTFLGRVDHCTRWAQFWAGGLTYYGGFIGAVFAARLLLRRDRFSFWKAADMAGMSVPLGLAFGRMGCLLAGCCFGKPSDVSWSLSFPPNSPASEWQFKHELLESKFVPSLEVHPTQIYESAASLAIAAICILTIHGRKRYDGQVFFAFVAMYAFARFMLEFWRSDDRGGLLGLSTSQLIGAGLIAVVIAIHRVRVRAAQSAIAPA